MNELEQLLIAGLGNYLLGLLEKKYGDRVTQLEQQVENLLSGRTADAAQAPAPVEALRGG